MLSKEEQCLNYVRDILERFLLQDDYVFTKEQLGKISRFKMVLIACNYLFQGNLKTDLTTVEISQHFFLEKTREKISNVGYENLRKLQKELNEQKEIILKTFTPLCLRSKPSRDKIIDGELKDMFTYLFYAKHSEIYGKKDSTTFELMLLAFTSTLQKFSIYTIRIAYNKILTKRGMPEICDILEACEQTHKQSLNIISNINFILSI
jgi:hypothetical protein